jgi:predicted RNase H-like HicB family nuclease
MNMKFNVILTEAREGGYNVTVPALDGCFTQGDSEAEALKNAEEAIICYLEGLEKLNQIYSEPKFKIKEISVNL